MKQHVFGDNVVYVEGGRKLNAIVLQSTLHLLNDQEEEHLVLSVPDPAQAAPTMSGNQIQEAMKPRYGVRPLANTKPANAQDGDIGTGWAERGDLESDDSVLKDGPLLMDLVHEINATHPITAYGKDFKDDDKFVAAAKHLGIEITPYSKDDVHAQIVKELQHQGVKPDYTGREHIEQSTAPVASPVIATETSYLDHKDDGFAGSGDPYGIGGMTNEGFHSEGKDEGQLAEEREAMHDPSKAAEAFDQNDLNSMPQATRDAVERGELDPVALNNNPETHPEFGTEAFVEPGQQQESNEEAEDEADLVEADRPFSIKEEGGQFHIVDVNGNILSDPETEFDESYDTREEAEAALVKYEQK